MSTSKWSCERANEWYEKNGWFLGCNYAPSTAVNQLEMWEADTFDPETIERELEWAEGLVHCAYFCITYYGSTML